MKNVFELTAFDTKLNAYIDKRFYSNRKVAHNSFIELKQHLIEINKLKNLPIQRWTFTDGGDNQTEIIGHLNITLVKWNIQTETLKF